MSSSSPPAWSPPASVEERVARTERVASVLAALNDRDLDSLLSAVRDLCARNPAAAVTPRTVIRIRKGSVTQPKDNTLELIETRLGLDVASGPPTPDKLDDGLPSAKPSFYEKDILDAHAAKPVKAWPYKVRQLDVGGSTYSNPLPFTKIGRYRRDDDQLRDRVVIDARVAKLAAFGDDFDGAVPALLEAGPRQTLCVPFFDREELNVGIVVSGGVAPGINAAIEGIVSRHNLYRSKSSYSLTIHGYEEGFYGMSLSRRKPVELRLEQVKEYSHSGGSIISTARYPVLAEATEKDWAARQNLLCQLVRSICHDRLEILYIIGGDGSMRCAHALATYARQMHQKGMIPYEPVIVGIPKTMDNDILFVWQSLGFRTAYERATEYVRQLHREVSSNPRLCIVQLYGADSGFVVCHAALASGVCDLVLFPEMPLETTRISQYMRHILTKRTQKPYGLIVMGETFIPPDYDPRTGQAGLEEIERDAVESYRLAEAHGYGDVDDYLRSAGRKIITTALKREITENMASLGDYDWKNFRVSCIEPKWLLRSCEPNTEDYLYGLRLGMLAVDNAMAGYTDFMVSQWLTEYVQVPLALVVQGKKRVYKEGIFCKQIQNMTGQFELESPAHRKE